MAKEIPIAFGPPLPLRTRSVEQKNDLLITMVRRLANYLETANTLIDLDDIEDIEDAQDLVNKARALADECGSSTKE